MIQPTLYFISNYYFLKDNFVLTYFYNYMYVYFQNPQKRFDNSHMIISPLSH